MNYFASYVQHTWAFSKFSRSWSKIKNIALIYFVLYTIK